MENIIDVSEATFEFDVIQRSTELPVVVDFWAPWCGPCRMLGPLLEKLAGDPDYEFVLAKVNVDENPNLSMQFRVQGIPAVKAFRNGQVVAEFVGVKPEPQLRQFLKQLTPSESDLALERAYSLLATHHWGAAEEAYRNVLRHQPDNQAIYVNLAQALLAQGKGCEAIGYLQDCTDGKALDTAEKLMPLARYLCQAKTDWNEDDDITQIEAQYRRCARLIERGNFAAALDGFLDVLRQDKQYARGDARAVVLAIFALLGDGDELTQAYRRELALVLF